MGFWICIADGDLVSLAESAARALPPGAAIHPMHAFSRFVFVATIGSALGVQPRLPARPAPNPLVQQATREGLPIAVQRAQPLDRLVVTDAKDATVEVRDGAGRVYASGTGNPAFVFRAGGTLGTHRVTVQRSSGEAHAAEFELVAQTQVVDGGKYEDMFNLLLKGMKTDRPDGVFTIDWNGRPRRMFVNWGLDHFHTMKGMKYFSDAGGDFIDMQRDTQREDGMIWSFINPGDALAYYRTAYRPFGYVRAYGDRTFVRQPSENHPEYIYVSSVYQWWKANGDDAWMRSHLSSAMRALDYPMNDPARWSTRFQLLKRVYTIDSWDFQVDDAYTPDIGLTNTMLVDPDKSKFGVFFGDNVHYAAACEELAEMLDRAGRPDEAARFRDRAGGIRQRLDSLSWNGRFFTHFIDEDPSVKRDLGVDVRSQLAQGNMYALNRGITAPQATAIIGTYQQLLGHLPVGSPGEWYSIYPPFERGFEMHSPKWQYMNGGVAGHAGGELALGAFRYGQEDYGRDILDRLSALGHRHGDKIWFAYTGSIPPPSPAPAYQPIDLSPFANMDLWSTDSPRAKRWMLQKKPGDDVRGLPTGEQDFAGIRFHIVDPARNERRAAVAVSHQQDFPTSVTVPVNAKAGSVYLLHTSSKPSSENVCGSVNLEYDDGTWSTHYIAMGKHLTYWWFSELKTPRSGIAWHGPNLVSDDVGLSWCALDNPHPDKTIAAIRLQAPEDTGIYTVVGLTLADRPHYVPPSATSYGGPDNWAAATAMEAFIRGLAGVDDDDGSEAFSHPLLSPRWDTRESRSIRTTVRYAPSSGYVSYWFQHDAAEHTTVLTITGSARSVQCHLPLPPGTSQPRSIEVDGAATAYRTIAIGTSTYLDLPLDLSRVRMVRLRY